jgi:hypothetical protein
MRILSLILGLSVLSLSSTTISTPSQLMQRQTRVFIMEDNELLLDELSLKYSDAMVKACDNDLDKAHQKWISTLTAMEKYAKLWRYDIDGVKIWVKIFCNKKGYIDYIAYSVNPNSKNINNEVFNQFLNRFLRAYRLDIRSSNHFSHYGRAAFPIKR